MTIYDDPNRECVGLDPAWVEGTGGSSGEPEVEPGPVGFDPAEHTVAEVQDYLDAHPDEVDAVLTAEASGKNRATLTGG